MGYSAYLIDDVERAMLKVLYPPKHDTFIGHHITEKFGIKPDDVVPNDPQNVNIIGYFSNNLVEFFTVEINGNTDRKNGGKYHLTWSINKDKGAKPVDSNTYVDYAEPISPIPLTKCVAAIL